jgi:hypothetical protein
MTVSLGQTVFMNALTPVRVVAVTNVAGTYYNGPSNNGVGATLTVAASSLTIDSVVVAEGDRVLLQNQTTAYQNGIYVVKDIGSTVVLQRSDDQQSIEQMKPGQFTVVGAGTTYEGAIYALIEPIPQVIGVDTIFYTPSSITAGSLADTLTSGQIFVGNSSDIATGVALSGDATMANTGAMTIAANAITTGKVANGAISSDKLAPTTIKYARVSLSAAQWNGMYATPVQIVAAQGAGTQIVVHAANLTMTFVAAQYAAGGVALLQYTNTANGAGTAATGTVAAATVNGLAASSALTLQGAQAAAAITAVQNQGIFISNQTAAFTTGDGTWVIDIWYSVRPA